MAPLYWASSAWSVKFKQRWYRQLQERGKSTPPIPVSFWRSRRGQAREMLADNLHYPAKTGQISGGWQALTSKKKREAEQSVQAITASKWGDQYRHPAKDCASTQNDAINSLPSWITPSLEAPRV